MKPTIKQLMDRIAALEAEVAILKARPVEHHHHYAQPLVGQLICDAQRMRPIIPPSVVSDHPLYIGPSGGTSLQG